MQKNRIVTTRKDGVRVIVEAKDPEIFYILDRLNTILKDQSKEQEKLLSQV